MRKELYLFRHGMRLSQQAMADKIGVNRETYASIERGDRDGRVKFWDMLQAAFDLTDAQKGELMSRES